MQGCYLQDAWAGDGSTQAPDVYDAQLAEDVTLEVIDPSWPRGQRRNASTSPSCVIGSSSDPSALTGGFLPWRRSAKSV
jgi:hypothetical protein